MLGLRCYVGHWHSQGAETSNPTHGLQRRTQAPGSLGLCLGRGTLSLCCLTKELYYFTVAKYCSKAICLGPSAGRGSLLMGCIYLGDVCAVLTYISTPEKVT